MNYVYFYDIFLQVCIHRMLNHDSIIRFYGQRKEDNRQYLFLEYASGGELFDKIGNFFHIVQFVRFWNFHILVPNSNDF